MSDFSTESMMPKEPPRTCGMCLNNSYCHTSGDNRLAELCARFRSEDATSSHRPDTLEQRYQQLEQVAKLILADLDAMVCFVPYASADGVNGYRKQLRELGVSVDD